MYFTFTKCEIKILSYSKYFHLNQIFVYLPLAEVLDRTLLPFPARSIRNVAKRALQPAVSLSAAHFPRHALDGGMECKSLCETLYSYMYRKFQWDNFKSISHHQHVSNFLPVEQSRNLSKRSAEKPSA